MSEAPDPPATSFESATDAAVSDPGIQGPVPAVNLRRSAFIAAPVGLALLIVLIAVGHPLAGVMFVVGLWLGGLNTYSIGRSVSRARETEESHQRRAFITGSFGRLALVTAVAIVLLVIFGREAITVVLGLAVFQVLSLASASIPLIKELRNS